MDRYCNARTLAVACWASLLALTWLLLFDVVPGNDPFSAFAWFFFLVAAVFASAFCQERRR